MPTPTEVFRARLREVRRLKNWTQAELAVALARAGLDIGEPAITRMERDSRGVSLDEAVAISAVLGVSPLHMFVPLDDDEDSRVTPQMGVAATDARAWARGMRPLGEEDERLFYAQTPESEADWFPTVPGPWRFSNQEDFAAARARWERDIMRSALSGQPGTGETEAEDIPVRRPGKRSGR
jgi:transcriptional regulator with XRE-family HTH domain